MKLRILIFQISAFFLVTGALFGQEYRGSVSGRVLDPSGAAVPNAHVTLTNTETKIHLTTDTNGEGNYTIPYLQPGIYNLRAERQGFKSFERAPIEVRINQLVQVDAQLELGNSTETINVQAETPLLDMGSASVGQTIDARRIQELPIQQGVPFHLIALSAGVVRTGTNMLDENPYDWSSITYSVGGASSNANNCHCRWRCYGRISRRLDSAVLQPTAGIGRRIESINLQLRCRPGVHAGSEYQRQPQIGDQPPARRNL